MPPLSPAAPATAAPIAIRLGSERAYQLALAAILVLAFALRLAGAQGSLWLDEAWSATLAHDVGTPGGVLFGINHDNNHHLNSLWLQLVGLSAPTWLMRLPAIVCGTLAAAVAAALGAPRGKVAALVAALLFAISPVLVTLGSEARGYAMMALALLVACLFTDRVLAGDLSYHRPRALALCFALGALAQLTMVFGVLAVCGRAFFTWWRREDFGAAVRRALALFGVPLLALGAVLGMVALAAALSPTGFQFGNYEPFALNLFLHAIVEMAGYVVGWPVISLLLPLGALGLLVFAPRIAPARFPFYALAIFAFPTLLALLQSGNPGHPRYYLVAGIGLLLLIAEAIARGLARPGRWRWIAGGALALITAGSLAQDIDLATNRRGDPGAAVRTLARLAPHGATVVLDRPTERAILIVAAAQQHYPLTLVTNACPPQRFIFADRYKGELPPSTLRRCGLVYQPVAGARVDGMSGTHWTLYRRPF